MGSAATCSLPELPFGHHPLRFLCDLTTFTAMTDTANLEPSAPGSTPPPESLTDRLAASGYWPARAARFLAEGKYSRAVETCKEGLAEEPGLVSGRTIYARALYHAGRTDSAVEQFYRVLALDPDNVVALKYLGDIKFTEQDEIGAFAFYRRVLEIDPHCREIACPVDLPKAEPTRTITIQRAPELSPVKPRESLREIVFYTETVGDLYLAQGHARLAAEVFRSLNDRNPNPRLAYKLEQAEKKIQTKER